MKKQLFVLFFVTSLPLAKAQSWAPNIGSYWYQSYRPFPTWCSEGYARFDYFKDSLISGHNCQAIKRFHYYNCQSGLYQGYSLQFYTYTNANNVVYVNDFLSTASVQTQTFDTLFYFNAAIGTKWHMSPDSYTTCTGPKSVITVSDTGHNVIQGVNLKWQKVSVSVFFGSGPSYTITDTIYERFGYLKTDVFNQANFCSNNTDDLSYATLRCYGDNQIINFKYGHNYNCDYIEGIKEEEQLENVISLYPNPSKSKLNMYSSYYDIEKSTIKITNQIGQLVLSEDYTNSITVEQLSAGLYTIVIKLKDGTVISKKWIKE